MTPFKLLFDLIGPQSPDAKVPTPTERSLAAVAGFLAAMLLAAIWGIAAGSRDGHIALGNALKVPMLLTASSIAALPLALVVLRLTSSTGRLSDLVVAHAAATFTGTLVLAVLAPIVALYQHSSMWAGPWIALGSAILGLVVGVVILIRVVAKVLPAPSGRRAVAFPFVILWVVQLSTLLQLASVMDPVFPERTVFGRGIDAVSDVSPKETDR